MIASVVRRECSVSFFPCLDLTGESLLRKARSEPSQFCMQWVQCWGRRLSMLFAELL